MPRLTRLLEPLCLCLALAGLPLVSPAQPANPGAASPQGSGNWKQLKSHEKSALAPLAVQWGELTDTQRSKWLTIAQQFDRLTVPEQQVMQARMKEWVALSPVQRNQARLNFNTVQGLSKDEKKTRWDEYQALSEEEKRKLSAGALTKQLPEIPLSHYRNKLGGRHFSRSVWGRPDREKYSQPRPGSTSPDLVGWVGPSTKRKLHSNAAKPDPKQDSSSHACLACTLPKESDSKPQRMHQEVRVERKRQLWMRSE
jgi:hypothetical protein